MAKTFPWQPHSRQYLACYTAPVEMSVAPGEKKQATRAAGEDHVATINVSFVQAVEKRKIFSYIRCQSHQIKNLPNLLTILQLRRNPIFTRAIATVSVRGSTTTYNQNTASTMSISSSQLVKVNKVKFSRRTWFCSGAWFLRSTLRKTAAWFSAGARRPSEGQAVTTRNV